MSARIGASAEVMAHHLRSHRCTEPLIPNIAQGVWICPCNQAIIHTCEHCSDMLFIAIFGGEECEHAKRHIGGDTAGQTEWPFIPGSDLEQWQPGTRP